MRYRVLSMVRFRPSVILNHYRGGVTSSEVFGAFWAGPVEVEALFYISPGPRESAHGPPPTWSGSAEYNENPPRARGAHPQGQEGSAASWWACFPFTPSPPCPASKILLDIYPVLVIIHIYLLFQGGLCQQNKA